MSITVKILLALLPLFVAGYLGLALLKPTLDDAATQATTLAQKHDENTRLETQLTTELNISHKREDLNKEIAALEETVPKTKDPELLTIDLEHMCKDAGMDLISMKSSQTKDNTAAAAAPPKPKQPPVATSPAKQSEANSQANNNNLPNNMQEFTSEVVVTGNFRNLEKLVYDLETYQKAVRISEIVSRIPKAQKKSVTTVASIVNTPSPAHTVAQSEDNTNKLPDDSVPGEDDFLGDPDELYISMKITAYYLP